VIPEEEYPLINVAIFRGVKDQPKDVWENLLLLLFILVLLLEIEWAMLFVFYK
jgi:hypothetical protein